jgi:glycerol kinase
VIGKEPILTLVTSNKDVKLRLPAHYILLDTTNTIHMDTYSPKNLYLCIDQGGHASRGIVFNQRGDIVTQSEAPLSATHTDEGFVEYDAAIMMRSLRQVIKEVQVNLGEQSRFIHAAGLATQRSNIACWDIYSGMALSPIISWQDCRAAAWLNKFASEAESIHQRSGLFLSPHYGASKLHWCEDNLTEVSKARDEKRLRYGPMASYLVHQLVQQRPNITDTVNATRTQLVDIQTLNWSGTLTQTFGIDMQCLPEIKPCYFDYGNLIETKDIPLKLVTGDQSAAMYAYGKIQPSTAYINIGTGAFLSRPSGSRRTIARRLLTSIIHHQNGHSEFALEATVNGAGSALDWFTHQYNVENLIEHLPDWLADITLEKAWFLNGIAGLGAPYWIADFPTRFEGSEQIEARAVAVVDSIVFLLHTNLCEMKKFASPPEQIQITGGLAHFDGLCQRLADLSGLAIYRPVESEATARGIAYLLAGSPDSWPENTPGDWFEPKNNSALIKNYDNWLSLMLDSMRKN